MKRNAMRALQDYRVDAATGFVPSLEPLDRLPAAFDPWEEIVPQISALIRSRKLRVMLASLPQIDPMGLTDDRERERALLLLTVFANGWVWGGETADFTIPANIAIPLCALAGAMQRPPIVHYASMTLHNWTRLDQSQPVSADNARMQVQFLGGVDEDWFFIGSLGVELAGAPLVPLLHETTVSSHSLGDEQLADLLDKIAAGIVPVTTALDRMMEWCDPHAFYLRVRPYLSGWPAPGVVYQGASAKPQIHVGGSAGQSSLIQSIDAVLCVDHSASGAGAYLAKLRTYMPVPHKAFVEDLSAVSVLRNRVASGSSLLRSAYNEAIAQLDTFRQHHIALARNYIAVPSGEAKGELGTGGTDFREFLASARAGTAGSVV